VGKNNGEDVVYLVTTERLNLNRKESYSIKKNNRKRMKELSVNHLLGIKYINNSDIDLIFETADHFKVINRPIKKVPSLRDITIANIFLKIAPGQNFPSIGTKDCLPM
jgi:hypothetical protein